MLIEKKIESKVRVESYQPGDKTQYKTGSPGLDGIPHDSQATVVSTSRGNLLSVRFDATREEVSYNPAQLRTLTRESHVYREEIREIAEGERIRFSRYDKNAGMIRSGNLGTVTRIGQDHSMTVKMDSATNAEISAEKARHIDYGYVVEGLTNVRAERILATGDGFAHQNLHGTFREQTSPCTPTRRSRSPHLQRRSPPPKSRSQRSSNVTLALAPNPLFFINLI